MKNFGLEQTLGLSISLLAFFLQWALERIVFLVVNVCNNLIAATMFSKLDKMQCPFQIKSSEMLLSDYNWL